MIIVTHFSQSVKEYIEAKVCPGREIAVPERCPHQACGVKGRVIRWGRYWRQALTGWEDNKIQIQRVRCQACKRTHALLPDFLHPHRHFVIALLQQVIGLYVLAGLRFEPLWERLPPKKPALSTLREWVGSFGWGAGYLLVDVLRRFVMGIAPEVEQSEQAPSHLEHSQRADLLKKSYHFWRWGEILYARQKENESHLPFSEEQFFPFLLHWLSGQQLEPRLLRSPRLSTTPNVPF